MNMAWDLGAVDGAWELCGLLNYGCWIWCLCYILQWDRRRGGSEGQSHSPGIWNGGTEICRNILMRKYCRLQGPDIQGFMSQVYFVAVSLVTWCLVWSQSHRMLVALGTAPGPGDQQCTVSEPDTPEEETSGLSWPCLQKSGEMKEMKVFFLLLTNTLFFPLPLLLSSCDWMTVTPSPAHIMPESDHCWVVCAPVWSAVSTVDDGSRTLLVLLFVLITFTTRPQLSGHYPIQTEISCRQAVITTRIRAGQWTFEARIVLLQVNASFMILTTCSRSEPQSQFRYLVWTNLLEFETHWICEEKSEKEFWHINYLSSGYLTPLPQISISLLAGNMD